MQVERGRNTKIWGSMTLSLILSAVVQYTALGDRVIG